MKKALIILLVVLLVGGGLFCLYFFGWTPENLSSLGDSAMASKKYSRAEWLYETAAEMAPDEPSYVLKLADACIADGSYTKAERSLVTAIRKEPSAALYCKLSSVYVAQDKLYDAQKMLDGISDSAIKAELDAMRPQAPDFSPAGGQYSEYIDLMLSGQGGAVYYSLTEEYPSTNTDAYADPFTLPAGDSHVKAILVGDNGLVSPLAEMDYLIVGVVEEVSFASSEFEELIREMLYIPRTSPVMTSDLWTVTELEMPENVTDFSDLSHFKNLTSLVINYSTIDDCSFFAGTPELQKLNLHGCSLAEDATDLIGTLAALTELDLSGCGISNISSLSNLTQLSTLNLSENSISDITPLSGLTKLTVLNLAANALPSLDALAEASQLTELDISENAIPSIAALSSCTGLTSLSATDNQISDISVLANMPSLQTLLLSGNSVSDVSVLSFCPSLTRLEIANNNLSSIDILANLVELTYLDISHNNISALPQLQTQSRLQQFYASYNQLSDISMLAGLVGLTYVDVDYNENIEDILCLTSCPLIVQIDAFGTKVADVKALTDMGVIVNWDPTVADSE